MSREYAGTVGVEFHSKTVFLPDGPVRLQLWDTAGHERFSALVPTYLKSAEAVLLTFDLTDRASFDEVTQYAELIAKHAVGLAPTRVLVLGNKSDLDDQRQVSHQEAAAKSIELGYDYMEVSATQPTNVVRCFRHLVAQVVAPDGRLEPTWTEIALEMPEDGNPSTKDVMSVPEEGCMMAWIKSLTNFLAAFWAPSKDAKGYGATQRDPTLPVVATAVSA